MTQATAQIAAPRSASWFPRILLVAALVVLANLVTPPVTAQAASVGTGYPATVSCKSVFEHSMQVDVGAKAAPGLASQNIAARIWVFDRITWKYLPPSAWKVFTHTLQTWVISGAGGAYLMNNEYGSTEFNFSPPSLPGGYYNVVTEYSWQDAATATWSSGSFFYTTFYKQDGQYLLSDRCVTK